MKKKWLCLLFIMIILCLTGCQTKTNNEIYNKVYNVTLDVNEFEDLIVAIGEKADAPTIGLKGYKQSIFGMQADSCGSGAVVDGNAILSDGTIVSLEDSITKQNVISYTYRAITNYHVIEGESIIRAELSQDVSDVQVTIEATDKKLDLALVSFTTTLYIKPLEFADSSATRKGQFVVAMGYPDGIDYYDSLTFGVISFVNRKVVENGITSLYIQTDVVINPGNSGGPLINMRGEIVGINTMKIVDEEIDGMGFAIPSNIVKEFINKNTK